MGKGALRAVITPLIFGHSLAFPAHRNRVYFAVTIIDRVKKREKL